MKTIQVRMANDIPEMLNITYVDETHFRASLVGGFCKEGYVYHIDEAKSEIYYEKVKTFLEEGN